MTHLRKQAGVCTYGMRSCTFDGWSECVGAVGPSEELCDGLDNNCNGAIDDTFPEQHQLCGFVEDADYGVGICTPGVMKCDNGSLYCDGHVGPSEEICDGLDNNCDGSVDEGVANTTAIVCYEDLMVRWQLVSAERVYDIVRMVVLMDLVMVRFYQYKKYVTTLIMIVTEKLTRALILVV